MYEEYKTPDDLFKHLQGLTLDEQKSKVKKIAREISEKFSNEEVWLFLMLILSGCWGSFDLTENIKISNEKLKEDPDHGQN